jgi:hypothetical protein
MTDLTTLAARVEALAGPCRETDAEIAELMHPHRTPELRVRYYNEATGEHVDVGGSGFLPHIPYTASLDAAMTLANGREWALQCHKPQPMTATLSPPPPPLPSPPPPFAPVRSHRHERGGDCAGR